MVDVGDYTKYVTLIINRLCLFVKSSQTFHAKTPVRLAIYVYFCYTIAVSAATFQKHRAFLQSALDKTDPMFYDTLVVHLLNLCAKEAFI